MYVFYNCILKYFILDLVDKLVVEFVVELMVI